MHGASGSGVVALATLVRPDVFLSRLMRLCVGGSGCTRQGSGWFAGRRSNSVPSSGCVIKFW